MFDPRTIREDAEPPDDREAPPRDPSMVLSMETLHGIT
jgi:hypothetical protein